MAKHTVQFTKCADIIPTSYQLAQTCVSSELHSWSIYAKKHPPVNENISEEFWKKRVKTVNYTTS